MRILTNIDQLRRERHLSVATLAATSAIALTTWYRRQEDPDQLTVRELRGIAGALDVTLAELFT